MTHYTSPSPQRRWILLSVLIVFALLFCGNVARAVDPEFVGVLALAMENDVAQRLGLSDEVRQELGELIDQRIKEAVSLALSIKDLPPVERERRLKPFVEESERLGMRLLTLEQRSMLNQLRLQRRGMTTLAEESMQQLLQLTPEQQQEIARLMSERAVAMTRGGESDRRRTRDSFERSLRGVLTSTQKATWDQMAGLGPGPSEAAADAGVASNDDADATDQETDGTAADTAAADTSDDSEVATPDTPDQAQDTEGATESEMNEAADTEAADTEAADAGSSQEGAADTEMTDESAGEGDQTSATDDAESAASPSDVRPPATDDTAGQEEPIDPENVKLRFNFRFQPWGDVLDWLAEQADLSLQSTLIPEGTFNYSDTRAYTPTEAIDLINGVLIPQGYTLVKRGRLLSVMNLEDPIPDVLVEYVPVEKLDEHGEFELVKTVFHLARMEPADAEQEIGPLIGPGRSMVVMPKARQILVTETVGKLIMIRDVLERAENPSGATDGVVVISLKYISPEELMGTARPLLGLNEGEDVGDDIAIAQDSSGTRLFANGAAEKIRILKDLAEQLDKPREVGPTDVLATEQPQLRTHYVYTADPNEALAVLQTLLAGLPDVRMSLDEKTNKIIALAPPSVHSTISETLKQLEGQAPQIYVIQLKRLDPQMAVVAIGNFFSGTEEAESTIKVDADPINMRLYVRATEAEYEQIKLLIEKLEGPAEGGSDGGKVRFFPMGQGGAETIDMARRLWLEPNKIELLTPSESGGPGIFDLKEINPKPPSDEPSSEIRPPAQRNTTLQRLEKAPPAASANRVDKVTTRRSMGRMGGVPVQFVSFHEADEEEDEGVPTAAPPAAKPQTPQTNEERAPAYTDPPQTSQKGAPIRIEFTPNGIILASEDTEALDKFEDLLRQIAGPVQPSTGKKFTVYFLKYCKADVAAQLISDILGGSTDSGTGGSLVGDVASNLMGGGGGLLGALLGGGGGGDGVGVTTVQGTGTVSIVPDARLNCLVVQGLEVDLKLIEQLLKVIDREGSITDIQTAGKPHIIPIIYMNANDVATVVREAYADRLAQSGSRGGSQGGRPDPAELIRALRGGGGRGRGGTDVRSEAPKMTIAVDPASNSLIVTAPEQLYEEVRELVYQIDQSNSELTEDVVVVPVKRNSEAVQRALASIMGAQSSNRSSSSRSSSSSSSSRPSFGGSTGDIQSRIDAIRRMQAFGGGRTGSFGGGAPSGFGRGGSTPGGFSRGGFSRGGPGGTSSRGGSSRGSSSRGSSSRGRGR